MSMMRILVFVLALGGAAVAAFLAKGLLGSKTQNAEAAPNLDLTEVLVAAKAINVGSKIALGDLKWQAWPKAAADASYISREAQPNALDEAAVGSVARAPLLAGEPITAQKVIRAESAGFLAASLAPGMRAVAVKVNAERGAGGFVLPNDRVDIIMTRKLGNDDGGVPQFRALTVLKDVRVLAIDQAAREEEGNQAIVGKTATLELTAEQAEVLSLAEAMGDLTMSLRSLTTAETAIESKVNKNLLGGGDEKSFSIVRYGVSQAGASAQ